MKERICKDVPDPLLEEDAAIKFDCGFQEISCDYRGKDGVCEIEDEEGNAVCPAGE